MIFLLLALVCLALGWFAGVYMVTRSLRHDIALLDADRAQLDIDRALHLAYVEAWLDSLADGRVQFDLRDRKAVKA